MAMVKIPYETADSEETFLELEIPDGNLVLQCLPQELPPISDIATAVSEAVEGTVDGKRFSQLIGRGKRIVFITENQFRSAPAKEILPPLVMKAKQAGCHISIIIGCGRIPPLSHEKIEEKLGTDLANSGIPVTCNDVNRPEDYIYAGTTSSGIPLFVHRVVAHADVIVTISTTQATLWGYGGSGMILPAVTNKITTDLNHIMSLAPDCVPGNNGCRMQMDKYEALEMADVDMGINVIMDNKNRVSFMNAGSPVASHRTAVQRYDEIYRFSLAELKRQKVDIAISGSSRVTNHLFFHTGWAVVNCDPIVRDKGIIILAAPCPGYENLPGFARMDVLEPYVPPSKENRAKALKDIYTPTTRLWTDDIPYKIYEVMARKRVWVVTDKANMSACRDIGIIAFDCIEEAFQQALKTCGNDAGVAFIPYGRYTVLGK